MTWQMQDGVGVVTVLQLTKLFQPPPPPIKKGKKKNWGRHLSSWLIGVQDKRLTKRALKACMDLLLVMLQ